ncbi:MAG TPA: flagellar biosynthetic protein FliO [Candidatus Sulfotelmatobacter sp.]|nr:flagellar biosynthetic protein FliO [Candidatus Sulfotelmatobacter sp.]
MRLSRAHTRQLRLCESLSLGDRRFVAVLEYEGSRFLLGGTSTHLVLLAQLGSDSPEHCIGETGVNTLRAQVTPDCEMCP